MSVLSAMQGGLGAPGAPGKPDDDILAFPLSPAQRRIWLDNERRPGNPAYNASFRWGLKGQLDLSALQRSFNEIVARHEVLRATFVSIDGEIHQQIAPSLSLLIPVTDLRNSPEAHREAEIERICAAEATRLFNLEKGPLIRVGLLRIDESQYLLMLTLHHIICDGWSIGVVMRELQQLYAAISEGRTPDLCPLSIQFPDYVVWSAEQAEKAGEEDLSYWADKLRDYQPFRLKPDLAEHSEFAKGAILSRLLPRSISNSLKSFSEQYGGTMYSTTLAACFATLHRCTGATDIAMWTPLASRSQPELENLVGLFVNQVAVRVDLSGDPSLRQLAARVRDDVWDALAHQAVPFENIVEALTDDQKTRGGQFCSVNFVCQRAFGGAVNSEFDFPGVQVSPIPSKSPGALFDLNFFLVERAEGWRLSLEYNADCYTAETGNMLIEGFDRILQTIARDPDVRLSGLPWIGPVSGDLVPSDEGEETSVFEVPATNETALDSSCEFPASVTQLRFWQLSRLRPDSAAFNMPASVRIAGPLSAELLQESLRVLVDRHEILRTVFKESDSELNQVVLSRAECEVHISDLQTESRHAGFDLGELLRDEALGPFNLERGPLMRVRLLRLDPDDHVLVVTVHHIISDGWSQSILQRELWAIYEALAADRTPGLPPLSIQYADFAVWQREWLESEEANEHLAYWMKTLAGPLPVLDFPTDYAPGQRHAVRGAVERVRLPGHLVERLKARSRSANVTMYMQLLAAFAILLERYTGQHDLTIGSPSANRNSQTEPMIGPFSGPIALRFDLAKQSTLDDVLRYTSQVAMDALDHAVFPFENIIARLKMRSIKGRNPLFQFYFLYQAAFLQRREAGELAITPISSASVGNPFELQLAVIERDHEVWLNLEYDQGLFQSKSIESIMSYYQLVLTEIATDPDKLVSDLKAPLVEWGQRVVSESRGGAQEFHQPRNPTEAKLLAIWERLFDLSTIGIRDDFFDLGGHSLLAATLIAEIKREFDVKIDLSKLLVDRTIEQLAALVERRDHCQQSCLVPLRATGARVPLFCVHGGGGHVLAYSELAKALSNDQPVYGLASPELDGAQRAMTVDELARLYNSEIRRVQAHGPYRICGYSFGGVIALEMARQLIAEGEEVPVLVILDTSNWGYYRHLSFDERRRFWSVRMIDRVQRYYRRIAEHRLDVALSSAFFFVRKKMRLRLWTLVQRLSRFANRPMPAQLRDNMTMFKAIAQSYEAKPLPVRIILFRSEERDPEYNLNRSLGWELVASEGVDVHDVPGDHLSFMRDPHVAKVALQLDKYLR